MKKSVVLLFLVAFAFSGQALAAPFNFNVVYDGSTGTLVGGSDNPVGTNIEPGDSFLWTISAAGTDFWRVDSGGNFFPLAAFGVSEPGERTGDYTLNLFNNGVSVFDVSASGVKNTYVHMGTNTIGLSTDLEFDQIVLSYSLTAAVVDYSFDPADPNNANNGNPTNSTISGVLPIFGAPDQLPSGGIVYVTGAPVPEPAMLSLMLVGLGAMGALRSRKD